MRIFHYGKAKTYPYYVKFADGRISGVFKTRKEAQKLLAHKFHGGKGKIMKRRTR